LTLSAGLAGLVVIALIGIAAGESIRRHLRLATLKADLVAAASHELRSPLAAMRVLVDGLLADPEPDPVKTREYMVMVARENARLSRLIENFLTFSRLDGGRSEFTFVPVQPSTLVETAIEAVRERLPQGCRLDVDVDAGLPMVKADADGLAAALVNLLENALKYTTDEKRITVRASADGGSFVRFDVTDNGIGIPASEQRRIFRRFYRVDQRLSRETAGVGLGLSIVELILRAHGGSVSVRSAPGAGSTFTLRVPCATEGHAA
jgi:signal transduction histidine kinase